MVALALVLAEGEATAACGCCGGETCWPRGPRWVTTEGLRPVCMNCTRRLGPDHAALLDLCTTAEKVGRHARHLLTPPMRSLLELARAAEAYAHANDTR